MRHMKAYRRILIICAAALPLVVTPQASAQATPCADLLIEDIAFSPAMPVQGQQANIAITVRNAGTCAAGGFVVQFKTDLFSPTGPSTSINSLAAGASTTVNLSFNFPNAGNFQTVVQVDTGNAVSETNEVNNLEIEAVTVLPPGVNLVIEDFDVGPEPVVQGRATTATIVVRNTGNVPAGAFRVEYTPFFLGPTLSRQINGLAAGASTTVTFDFTFPFAATVGGVAVVDAGNAVFETNEFDNVATQQTVVEPPLPNLRVSAVNTVPAPAGSVSRIDITVVNDGNNPAGDFIVRWDPGFLQAPLTRQVNGLAVGASTVVSFDHTFSFAGTFDGTITVDSTSAVAEVDETDNTRATRFEIPVATVDLTIDSLTISPASPVQGAPATATVVVRNQGNSPSGRFVVDWNPDAFGIIVPSVQTLSQETGPLGPGQTRALTFSFTYPQAGNFRSIANVDSFNTVNETNEANNQRILNVTVQPAPLDLVFVGGITFNPAQPVRGVNATASVTVRNDGPIATGPFAVQFKSQDADFFPQLQFVNGLNPGETRTLTFTVNYFIAGTFTATATLDVFNQVNEAAPGGEGNNVRTQSVTVIPQEATVDVTLTRLRALNDMEFSACLPPPFGNFFDCGSGEWDNIIFAVFDPAATCNVTFFGQELDIPSLACTVVGDNDVNANEDVNINRTFRVRLVEATPLVAAVAALESDAIIPDFPGFALFVSTRPAYLNLVGEQEVQGQSCARLSASIFDPEVELTPVDDGHCFNAFFEVTPVNVVGPSTLSVSRRTSAAGASAERSARAGSKARSKRIAKRVAKRRAAYVRRQIRRVRRAVATTAARERPRGELRIKARTKRVKQGSRG